MGMLLSTREAASRLGLCVQRVRILLNQGRISGTKVGRDWLIDPAALRRFRTLRPWALARAKQRARKRSKGARRRAPL